MGLLDDAAKGLNNIVSGAAKGVNSAADGLSHFVSQGTKAMGNFYGFDDNGKFDPQHNGIWKWSTEAAGEVTGANASRAALNQARDQFDVAQKQAAGLIAQQRWNAQQADISGSNNAAAMTASGASTGGANYGNSTPLGQGAGFNGGNKDFLGL